MKEGQHYQVSIKIYLGPVYYWISPSGCFSVDVYFASERSVSHYTLQDQEIFKRYLVSANETILDFTPQLFASIMKHTFQAGTRIIKTFLYYEEN